MIYFELGFEPNAFEKATIEQTKADAQQRLEGQLLEDLKIVLKKLPGNRIVFHFVGDPDSVDRAKRLLGIE
jgi:hypothetical protein